MVKEIQSGIFKDNVLVHHFGYDLQSLEDAFWSQHSTRLGVAQFDDSGAFLGCSTMIDEPINNWRWGHTLSLEAHVRDAFHCILSVDYNFFVDFKSIFGLVFYNITDTAVREWRPR